MRIITMVVSLAVRDDQSQDVKDAVIDALSNEDFGDGSETVVNVKTLADEKLAISDIDWQRETDSEAIPPTSEEMQAAFDLWTANAELQTAKRIEEISSK